MTSDTMFSERTVPWMKLGGLTSEPKTATEAAKLGGIDFTVEKRPIWYGDTDELATSTPIHRMDKRVAIVRTDTNECLGVMSRNYPVFQYAEAFEFMDTVGPSYVAAGALNDGAQGFMVVRPSDEIRVLDEDPHDVYVVLRTSHDGSRAVEVSVMSLRLRCMNQLTLKSFSNDAKYRWSVSHTSNMRDKLADAQTTLKRYRKYADRFEDVARSLIKIKIKQPQAEDLLKVVLPDRPRRDDTISSITQLWHNAPSVGFDWTGWGLVNAVSEYFDWQRAGGSPSSRFTGALQGTTHRTINQVASHLLTRFH